MIGVFLPSLLCRSFKRHFGISAEEYRRKNGYPDSKKCQFKSINEQHTSLYSRYFCRDKTIKVNGMDMNCTFEIKQMPERAIIYCRHQGALGDQMQEAFANLMKWALPRGFVSTTGYEGYCPSIMMILVLPRSIN